MTVDPSKEISKLFEMLDTPQEYVQSSLKALDRHAQMGVLSETARSYEITQEAKHMMDRYFKELDLPVRTTSTLEEFKHFFGLNQD